MKKSKLVSGRGLGKAPKKLSQPEMEHELDHCRAPWKCPAACYKACIGCMQKGGEKIEQWNNGITAEVHPLVSIKGQMPDTFPGVHQQPGSVVADIRIKDEAREKAGIHAHSMTWRWFE